MPSLLTHLFPTATSLLFAVHFAIFPSFGALISYVVVALLGGVVHAAETMATDNHQLGSLAKAVRQLSITDVDQESYRELLPAPGVHYVARRLKKEHRPADCYFFNSSKIALQHALAFRFSRFFPICLHSLGTFSGRQRKSMILYHELGHLFFLQPRGGYIALLLGSVLPLFWIACASPDTNSILLVTLVAICILEFLAISLLNALEREIFADGFALASKFTDVWMTFSMPEVEQALQRGTLFENIPGEIALYEKLVTARGLLRGLLFRRAYKRTNTLGWLNKKYLEFARQAGGLDPYWQEVFYRRALQGALLSPRLVLVGIKLLLLVVMAYQLQNLSLQGGTLWVVVACAVTASFALPVTAWRLDESSRMVTQATYKGPTSLLVVQEALSENSLRHTSRQLNRLLASHQE